MKSREDQKKTGRLDEKCGEEKRGLERKGEASRKEKKGLRPVEVAGLLHFGTADLQSDTLQAPSSPFLKTVWMAAETKLAFSAAPRPLLVFISGHCSQTQTIRRGTTENAQKGGQTIKFGGGRKSGE